MSFHQCPGYSVEDFIISEVDSKIIIDKKKKKLLEKEEEHTVLDTSQAKDTLIIKPPENFETKW